MSKAGPALGLVAWQRLAASINETSSLDAVSGGFQEGNGRTRGEQTPSINPTIQKGETASTSSPPPRTMAGRLIGCEAGSSGPVPAPLSHQTHCSGSRKPQQDRCSRIHEYLLARGWESPFRELPGTI